MNINDRLCQLEGLLKRPDYRLAVLDADRRNGLYTALGASDLEQFIDSCDKSRDPLSQLLERRALEVWADEL